MQVWSESAKTFKAPKGWRQVIQYLAPARAAGGPVTVCPWATEQCERACLAWHSGMAAIGERNSVRDARVARVNAWRADPDAYVALMHRQLQAEARKAARQGERLAARANGGSDLPFWSWLGKLPPVECRWNEYTKNPAWAENPPELWGQRIHVTYSASERDTDAALGERIRRGWAVAIVSADADAALARGEVRLGRYAAPCIDGDTHDLRFLDRAELGIGEGQGYAVLLRPKGHAFRREAASADAFQDSFARVLR